MELDFEIDDFFKNKMSKSPKESAIMMTLSSRVNYDDAKLISMYANWKKLG